MKEQNLVLENLLEIYFQLVQVCQRQKYIYCNTLKDPHSEAQLSTSVDLVPLSPFSSQVTTCNLWNSLSFKAWEQNWDNNNIFLSFSRQQTLRHSIECSLKGTMWSTSEDRNMHWREGRGGEGVLLNPLPSWEMRAEAPIRSVQNTHCSTKLQFT